MSAFIVEYGEGPKEETVSTVEEFDAVHRQADEAAKAAGLGYMMFVMTDAGSVDGPVLGLGVGRGFSYLLWSDQHVAGTLDGGEPTMWIYGNQPSQVPAGRGIPNILAVEKAREFIRTGERPSADWTTEG